MNETFEWTINETAETIERKYGNSDITVSTNHFNKATRTTNYQSFYKDSLNKIKTCGRLSPLYSIAVKYNKLSALLKINICTIKSGRQIKLQITLHHSSRSVLVTNEQGILIEFSHELYEYLANFSTPLSDSDFQYLRLRFL